MVGIYKITSPSGRIYIGQSWGIKERFRRYRSMKCERQIKLYASFVKYGVSNHSFEVIREYDATNISQGIIDSDEIYFIKYFKDSGIEVLNLQEGGSNGRHSEETKEKIRKANTGKIFTDQRLRNMSISNTGKPSPNKGKKMSEDTKKLISKAHIGKTMPENIKQKISEKLKGRIFSEKTRKKLSDAGKGRRQTAEHTENNRQARLRRSKKVQL